MTYEDKPSYASSPPCTAVVHTALLKSLKSQLTAQFTITNIPLVHCTEHFTVKSISLANIPVAKMLKM